MGLLGPQGDANLVTNLFLVHRQKQTLTLLPLPHAWLEGCLVPVPSVG